MLLNPYGQDAVVLAADLANDPPSTAEALVARCRDAGLVGHASGGDDDLVLLRTVLGRWLRLVDVVTDDERVVIVNGLLAEFCAHPRVTRHADDDWHLHFRDDGRTLGQVLGALIAMGSALHLTGRGMHRLGRCRVDDCDRVFADVSRTGRRRYCSTACANRDAVRRHRRGASAGRPRPRL